MFSTVSSFIDFLYNFFHIFTFNNVLNFLFGNQIDIWEIDITE